MHREYRARQGARTDLALHCGISSGAKELRHRRLELRELLLRLSLHHAIEMKRAGRGVLAKA